MIATAQHREKRGEMQNIDPLFSIFLSVLLCFIVFALTRIVINRPQASSEVKRRQLQLSFTNRVMYLEAKRQALDESRTEMRMAESEIPETRSARPIMKPSLELCTLLSESEEKQRNNLQNDRKPAGNFTSRAREMNFLP